MLLKTIEEVFHHIGQQIICSNIDQIERPEYLVIIEVQKAILEDIDIRNKDEINVVVCGKRVSFSEEKLTLQSIKHIKYIFFDPQNETFKMNSFSGPKVSLHTPFDYTEESNKNFVAIKRALIKHWYKGSLNEKGGKVLIGGL